MIEMSSKEASYSNEELMKNIIKSKNLFFTNCHEENNFESSNNDVY
jgi:hypothetical protein